MQGWKLGHLLSTSHLVTELWSMPNPVKYISRSMRLVDASRSIVNKCCQCSPYVCMYACTCAMFVDADVSASMRKVPVTA